MDAFTEDEAPNAKGEMERRAVMKLDPRLAPTSKVAVLPLISQRRFSPKARDLAAELRKIGPLTLIPAQLTALPSSRMKIGTLLHHYRFLRSPQGNDTVTIRHRDSMAQRAHRHC
jgi:glycyl-tRNA synthetase